MAGSRWRAPEPSASTDPVRLLAWRHAKRPDIGLQDNGVGCTLATGGGIGPGEHLVTTRDKRAALDFTAAACRGQHGAGPPATNAGLHPHHDMSPPTLLRDPVAVTSWLDGLGVQRVLLLSPHLDDAVFSATALLRAAAARTTVLTVFTDGAPGQVDTWTRDTGFADAEQEFETRREEDVQAMRRLGCSYLHAGLRSGQLDEGQARHWADRLADDTAATAGQTLVLLPAAAGGSQPYTGWQALWTRLTRRPFGAPAHGDHRLVRDRFWHALSRHSCRLGFYAELPYIWKQGDAALQTELTDTFRVPMQRLQLWPDASEKRAVAACYGSQMPLVFGRNMAYRDRALGRHECIFLAGADGTAR